MRNPATPNAAQGIMAMVKCLNILKSAEGTICTGREMTRDDAEAWAAHMVNEDGTTGSHWPMEQITALAESMGLSWDRISPWCWWVTMNMMYSDYGSVAIHYGVSTAEFFAELEAEIAKGNADGKNFKTLAFSQVRMSIYFNDSDYEWEKIADGTAGDILRMTDQMNAYPARLGMYTNYKTLTPISDYAYIYEQNYGSSVTLAYNGKINRSRGCYVMDITGYMQQLWNSYMEAKADAGGEVANIDWDKVKNRSVYIGPEAYSLYTTSFGVLQGMPTQAGTAEPNNAPIRFSMAYNLIK